MIRKIKRLVSLVTASVAAFGVAFALPVAAAASTLVVTPTNNQGWVFNPDPANSTPYNFTEDRESIGAGSLYVQPISATAAHKFIAAQTLNIPVADFSSLSYDFLIAGDGTVDDADQFYLNVYTLLPNTTETFFSCRFDYVPSTGSTTEFTTANFTATDTPTHVQNRNESVCPETLEGMPEGSTVSFIALNVGDTSLNDAGLAGYLDNVIITTSGNIVTYDFELNEPGPAMPSAKDDCKQGRWSEYGVFKNQGDCVSFVASQGRNKPAFANQN